MHYPLMRNNFEKEDLDAVVELLSGNDPKLTNGPKVRQFEEEWSKWLNVKYSVFVNSGSSANMLSMMILKDKFPNGGEVIVPPLTWVSDIVAVLQAGFTPVFVDVEMSTLGMKVEGVLKAINEETRAVFLSHIQGYNALTDELLNELKHRDVALIEDVCESHGATHKQKKLGSIGWMSNFSFYYAHHMSTIEGGMVCTNDKSVYHAARMLRSHGMVREIGDPDIEKSWIKQNPDLNSKFIFAMQGMNVRNTEIGGVLGLSQLRRLDKGNELRTRNHLHFLKNLDASKFFTQFRTEGSSNYAFNLILKHQDASLVERLTSAMDYAKIEYRRGSAGGGNQLRQPYMQSFLGEQWKPADFPVTEHIHFFGFYIGNFPSLELEDVSYICDVINSA